MKRFLQLLVLLVLVACQGRDAGGEAERETPATDTIPMADTIEVTPDTIMARDTAF